MSEIFGTLSLDTSAFFEYTLADNHHSTDSLENTSVHGVRLGCIKGMHVSNFKSFENEHYVGPFTRFTCVIGPNGGGKSNVLDAIQFVLGMSIRSMRCRSIDELLYSRSQYFQNAKQDPSEAYVEIIFEAFNYIETQIMIRRTLKQNGHTSVQVGDVFLNEKEFGKFLLMSKIIVPSRNFVMNQGETDYLATIEPKKLTELFEFVSGSIQYKNSCSQIQGNLSQTISKMRDLQIQKGQLRNEQKRMRELRQTNENYKVLNEQIAEIRQKLKLMELYDLDTQIDNTNELIAGYKISQHSQNDENRQIIDNIQECEKKMQNLRDELKQIDQAEKQHKKMEGNQQFDNKNIDVEMELLKKQIEGLQSMHNRYSKDKNVQLELLEELGLDLKQKEKEIEKLSHQQSQMKLPEKLVQELKGLQDKFRTQNQQTQSEIQKLQQKQRMYYQLSEQIDDEMNQLQSDLKDILTEKQEIQASTSYVQNQLEALNDKHNNVMKRLEQLQHQNLVDQLEIKQLTQYRNETERELHLMQVQETENIDEKQTQLLIQQLRSLFTDFKGELSSLCFPEQQQFAIALKVALGQRLLCALVVESEDSTLQINKHLKSLDLVKELIVLNRLKKQTDDFQLREKVEQSLQNIRSTNKQARAYLAIDIIKYEDYLNQPLKHLLYGIVVCDTYKVAVELQKAQIPEVKQIITFEGISFNSSGMIVYNGSSTRLAGMRNFRQNNQRIQKNNVIQTRESLQKQFQELKDKIKSLRMVSVLEDLKQQSAIKMKLEEQKVQLLEKNANNKNRIESINLQEQDILQEISKLKAENTIRQEQLNQTDTKLKELTIEIDREQKVSFKDFAKKNKLDENALLQMTSQNTGQLETKQLQQNKLIIQKSTIENEIELLINKIQQNNEEIKQKQAMIEAYQKRKQDLSLNYQSTTDEVKAMSAKEHQLNAQIKLEQKNLKNLIELRDKQVKKGVDCKQSLNIAIRKLESLKYQRVVLIEQCEIESIVVAKQKSQQQSSYNFDEENLLEIDYSIIKSEIATKNIPMCQSALDGILKKKDQEITKYLSENLQIGLMGGKSDEKFYQLEKTIESLTNSIKELLIKETDLNEQLIKSKSLRKQRFENLFERVEKELKMFYSKLTENQNRISGSVVLYVENKEEPFDGGIIYTPNPPNKKYIFDNSEQLSGGEKTIASLSLLLAINSAIESPFILFDEVDAHLDSENAEKLQYIFKTLSNQIQFILVSHNSDLFSHADSLLGVTIQFQRSTSEVFSLQLY